MGSELLIIGVDAATWKIIEPNLDQLPNFKNLREEGEYKTIKLDQKPWSASCWTSMFSGKKTEEHGHTDFVENDEIVKREDIDIDFVWDVLDREGYKVKALNVPFVVPPFSYNLNFKPPANGIPTELDEMDQEIKQVTAKAKEVLKENLDLFIVCYVSLDKLQHHHWGEEIVLDYYKKIDRVLGQLKDKGEKLIVISDHGFADFGETEVQTLPKETPNAKIKGDHDKNAILITRNIKSEIENLRDVQKAILSELKDQNKI